MFGRGLSKELFCYGPPEPQTASVDPELCTAAELARAECKQVFIALAAHTGDAITELLKEKKAVAFAYDPDFSADCALISYVSGAASEKRILEDMLVHYPSATKNITLEATHQNIMAMTKLSCYKFSSHSA